MTFTDQMGREITLAQWPPQRIISLVPSQTEYLAALGLDAQVIGITKFCTHPQEWFQHKKRVGGTKTIDFKKIEALKPDLILGNKEENDQTQIEYLSQHYPVWMSDIYTLEDALDMMQQVGRLTDKATVGSAFTAEITQAFAQFTPQVPPLKAAYLIWRKPYMAAGSGTFIDDMLRRAGFKNVFQDLSRYPEIPIAQLAAANPDVILLSSEPFPFSEKHIADLQEICPGAKVQLVDGALFSWYGSRLVLAPEYFAGLRSGLGG